MLDQLLFWLETAVLILASVAVLRKLRGIPFYGWVIGVFAFGVVLKLVESLFFFLLILKPHASDRVALIFYERCGQANVVLLGLALAVAVYHLGGKPTRGFWKWIFEKDEADKRFAA